MLPRIRRWGCNYYGTCVRKNGFQGVNDGTQERGYKWGGSIGKGFGCLKNELIFGGWIGCRKILCEDLWHLGITFTISFAMQRGGN
jgi:hypothetical protein